MNAVPSIELVKEAEKNGYAIPSFCVWNAESVLTVLECADELKAPIILMNGWAEFKLLNPFHLSIIVNGFAKNHKYPYALHLDHGQSIKQVEEGVLAGYTSVMLDFSTKAFEENCQGMQKVVTMANPMKITVEGELGAVGMADQSTVEGSSISTLTHPEEAKIFVEKTGIDMLAVSIGNAHGIYSTLPHLDFKRLKKIHELINIPIVLHGGSGTPEEDIRKAISLGIAKVNVASDLVHTVRNSLMDQWNAERNNYTPFALVEAMKEMKKMVKKWIRITGSQNRA